MPLRIENSETARFRAQSTELWRPSEAGGGQSYANPHNYQHATLPTMVKENTYKPTGEILKSGKPLFYSRFPGNGMFNPSSGASESPCNLSLLDTLSVQREWCVREHQDVMKWTVGKRFAIRHKKFDRSEMRPSQVHDGVSKVETQCDRDREFLRFPVQTSEQQQHLAEISEELDYEVDVIVNSGSKFTGDIRNEQLVSMQATSSPIPSGAPMDQTMSRTIADSRAFQTPGLLDKDATRTGFAAPSHGLPFINFGKDRFSLPKHRRPLPEVGFNKYGPVGSKPDGITRTGS